MPYSLVRPDDPKKVGPLVPDQQSVISEINFGETGLRGFSEHVYHLTQGSWKIVVDPSLPDTRITQHFANAKFSELLRAIAKQFGACYEINEKQKVVTFRAAGSCS